MAAIDYAWRLLKEEVTDEEMPEQDESAYMQEVRALMADHKARWGPRHKEVEAKDWVLTDQYGEPQPAGMQRKEGHKPVRGAPPDEEWRAARHSEDHPTKPGEDKTFRGKPLSQWRDEGVDLSSFNQTMSPQLMYSHHKASEDFSRRLAALHEKHFAPAAMKRRAEETRSKELQSQVDEINRIHGTGGGSEEEAAPAPKAPKRQSAPSRGRRGGVDEDIKSEGDE